MYKKSTGWVPDYPDFRDYRMDEINQKLMITVQDIQINNDNDYQSSIEELFDLLKLIKEKKLDLSLDNDKRLASKFDKFEQKIHKGFKLVNAKALTEQTFLTRGCVGEEVYNLQKKLLIFTDYSKIFGTWSQKIDDLRKAFETSDYIEYGYFGKHTEEGVKLFKKIFDLSIASDDSTDIFVDKVTIYTLDQVLKILENIEKEKASKNRNTDKKIKSLEIFCEKNKEIQNNLNTLGYLKNLGGYNGAIKGLFDELTQEAFDNFKRQKCSKVDDLDGIVDEHTITKLTNTNIVDSYNSPIVVPKKQQRWLVLPASSAIPKNLYEIILRIFAISDLDISAEHLVKEKGFPLPTDINRISCIDEHCSALKQAIVMIVKLVAQLISPLAQHKNLEKAVRDVLEKLDQWFDKSQYVKNIRQENNQLSILHQAEQEKKLFKDGDLNPVSLYIAISTIFNFKLSLHRAIKDKDRVATSLKKIDDIFKSIKDLRNLEVNLKKHNPQLQEENNLKNQHKNLRTVIQILPELENELKYLENNPELQIDLQIPLEGNLWKNIIPKQGDVAVYLLMPEFVDLTFWCSPIEDQGSLDSCTAHAGVALMEYFEKRSFDRYVDASRLFLYKATRNLMHRQGDAGASLRETMRAMALFGVPPEEYWPYKEDKFDEEPTPFCYSFGQSYQALKYFRLNPLGTTENILLFRIKTALAAGFPCAFGFTMYYSIEDVNPSGYIPYPVKNDKVKGGHAVVAVGYDDHKVIENADGSKRSQGALLIRNCWGTDWGEGGYGWLPYDYVLEGLTNDWWSLLKSKWFETGHFGLEANDWVFNLGGGGTDATPKENPKPPNPPNSSGN